MPQQHAQYPRVSIVTVTYNAERYLSRTIESVLGQDYPNIEYIIIDGQSDDATIDIIQSFGEHLSYWHSQPDGGVYDAMNQGMARATGQWINFLNAADVLSSSDVISRLMAMVNRDTDILCGDIYQIFENSSRRLYRKAPGLGTILKPLNPCTHQAAFIRLQYMKKYPYSTKYRISADYEFFLKAYLDHAVFQFVDFAVCDFLVGGVSAQNQILGRAESVNSMVEHLPDSSILARDNVFVHAFDHLTRKNENAPARTIEFAQSIRMLTLQLDPLKSAGASVVIYGNGTAGHFIAKYLSPQVRVTLTDSFAFDQAFEEFPVCHPSDLKLLEYDWIVISALGKEGEISDYLCNQLSINPKKIITLKTQMG